MDSNRVYYRINKHCSIFSELMTIFLKTFIIVVEFHGENGLTNMKEKYQNFTSLLEVD